MKRFLLATVAVGALGSFAVKAAPIAGTFGVTVYQGTGNGTSNAPTEQAGPSNPFLNTAAVGSFRYTGALDFALDSNGTNTVAAFIASGGGTTAGGTVPTTTLSTATFAATTLFVITGDTFGSTLAGSVSHDDGASLFAGSSTVNLLGAGSGSPTVDVPSAYAGLSGPFTLYYVEANGLPADLDFEVTRSVPEPMSLALLSTGLLTIGAIRGRSRR